MEVSAVALSLLPTQLLAGNDAWILATEASDETVNPLLGWLPLILIGLALYFLAIRPQRKRAEAVRTFQKALEIGDEVRTAGGIIGVVTGISDSQVMLDIGGLTVTFVRGAIAGPVGDDTT